jgi:sugar phosphate isomerase/epimerase
MPLLFRREFLSSLFVMPAVFNSFENTKRAGPESGRLKTSLNAFSFNKPLTNGSMTVFDLLEFCAAAGFEGVDITGYYLKGYPVVPDDEYLYKVKRMAFGLGLEISGTGVRNDFTIADKRKRGQEVDLVKKWIEAAAKIDAPVIRIFTGNQKNEGVSSEKVTEWMLEDIRTCVEYGKQHGVIIGLQNHNDFIQTADQVIGMIDAVNSEWLGLILDTGSYRVNDPYDEIQKSVGHTVNWQIKENVFINGREVETDMPRLIKIIRNSGYSGYLPLETLGEGDPKEKVNVLFKKLKDALNVNLTS